jgi:hypothetical protein
MDMSPANAPDSESSAEDTNLEGEAESFRQMQLDMLRSENKDLSSRLDNLTVALHAQLPQMTDPSPFIHGSPPRAQQFPRALSASAAVSATPPLSPPLSTPLFLPEKIGKCPRTTDVNLTFQGSVSSCDRALLTGKLLHLKRLLHRRLEASIKCGGQRARALRTMGYVLESLDSLNTAPLPGPPPDTLPAAHGRIRVVCSHEVSKEVQAALSSDICSIANFTQALNLEASAITFHRCPHATTFQKKKVVLILPSMYPRSTHVSACYYMCPHTTTIPASSSHTGFLMLRQGILRILLIACQARMTPATAIAICNTRSCNSCNSQDLHQRSTAQPTKAPS